MKVNISRQYLFILLLSTILLIFVLVFSFAVLIPKGKEYREQRTELRKTERELRRYEDFNNLTLESLKKLQSENRHIISAFDAVFNADRFVKQHKNYFSSLTLSKMKSVADEDIFAVYEVNTTSYIDSPTTFYNFLDAINKGNWMIGINFPIYFKREKNIIKSNFTMKIYCDKDETVKDKDLNTSKAP